MSTTLPEGITLSLALVQRPGPLTNNIFEMALSAMRGHWAFLGDQRLVEGVVLLEGCFPTSVAEMERIEALCKACADFGCRAEVRLGDRRGTIIVLSARPARNTLETPVRGDRYVDSSAGTRRLIAVDALIREGIRIEIDGAEVGVVPWDSWGARAVGFVATERAKDPCPNHDPSGRGHIGREVHVKNLGRCYNRYRCLACGRTYDVDSSD